MNMSEICQEVVLEELLKNKDKNIVTSPVSLDFVLYMLALGCSAKDGPTSLLSKLSGVGNNLESLLNENDVGIYNIMLVKEGMPVKETYANNLRKACNGSLKQFNPLQPHIQQDMEKELLEETDGILTVVPNLSTIDASIINATRFKGKWEFEFSENNCYDDSFFNGNKIMTASYLRGKDSKYIKNEVMEGIELRYANPDFTLFMLLPNDSSVSLSQCLSSLDYTALANLYETTGDSTDYSFPEFEISTTLDMTPIIEKMSSMGIDSTFNDILEDQNLFVSNITQGAKITVDRKGTVAEAFTFADLVNCFSMSALRRQITFNKPFLYGIKYIPTDNILFLGTCYSPEKK